MTKKDPKTGEYLPDGLLARIKHILIKRSAGSEADSDYNGVFSYAGEYHAFIVGLSVGLVSGNLGTPEVALGLMAATLGLKGSEKLSRIIAADVAVAEIRREPWYSIGGVVVGYLGSAVAFGTLPV